MKKIINIIVLALSVFSLFSCQDFLKEESKSQMTLDYYYTDKGLKEGVAAVYSSCREMFRQNMFEVNYFSDLSELAASQNNTYDHVGKVSVGFLNALFADMHQGIMIINRMERVIGDNPETRTKEIYLAELRGFRAMFYQYQVELWGKYGHYQETVYDQYEESMLYLNQKPVSFYYEQILKDIDYAIEKLPTQSEIKEFGRLSQGAAKALKARFLLAIAGYSNPEYAGNEEYNICTQLGFASENDLYVQARALARSVINDYNYTLLSSYGDNFDEGKQVNKEVIWSVQWTTDKTFNTDDANFHRPGIGRTCETLDLKETSNGVLTATTRSLAV
ncbi:RagB/SusD family nutrient uptake outer membrane protein, partial [Parabacteroides merdae]